MAIDKIISHVDGSSARYAQATTELSNTIIRLEQYLDALPGKREITVSAKPANPSFNDEPSLRFARGKDGSWRIWYVKGPMTALLEATSGKQVMNPVLFRDTDIETKLKMCEHLPELLKAMVAAMNQEAATAESACRQVNALFASLKNGGV